MLLGILVLIGRNWMLTQQAALPAQETSSKAYSRLYDATTPMRLCGPVDRRNLANEQCQTANRDIMLGRCSATAGLE